MTQSPPPITHSLVITQDPNETEDIDLECPTPSLIYEEMQIQQDLSSPNYPDQTPPTSPNISDSPTIERTYSFHEDLNLPKSSKRKNPPTTLEEVDSRRTKFSKRTKKSKKKERQQTSSQNSVVRMLRELPVRIPSTPLHPLPNQTEQILGHQEMLGESNLDPLSQESQSPSLRNSQEAPDCQLKERTQNPIELKSRFQLREHPAKSAAAAGSSNQKFRFQAASLFCTYPQCAAKKEDVLANIVELWGNNVLFAIVAEEKHKDGSPHLHALIKFHRQISSRNANFADSLSGSHGNYRSAKSMWRCYNYVTKDGCFVVHGDVPESLVNQANKKSKSSDGKVTIDEVAESMMQGAAVKDIFHKYPGKFLMHRSRIESFAEYLHTIKLQEKMPFPGFYPIPEYPDHPAYLVVKWLKTNLFAPRAFKQPQLYLHGPRSTGKTSMVLELLKYFRVYFVPMDEEFYDEYEDNLYDIAFFEEFMGQKPLSFMNSWLDGSPKTLRKKNRQYLKVKNMPCILCSNCPPESLYPNVKEKHPEAFEAWLVRLEAVELPQYSQAINIDVAGSLRGGNIRGDTTSSDRYFLKLPLMAAETEQSGSLPSEPAIEGIESNQSSMEEEQPSSDERSDEEVELRQLEREYFSLTSSDEEDPDASDYCDSPQSYCDE